MDINAIIAAVHSKQWIVLGAILVGALVAASKQGWLGTWLQSKLPPAALPYFAIVLGMLGVATAEVVAGKPILQALIDGFESGAGAVFLHQTVIEGMRGGRELLPEKVAKVVGTPSTPPKAA
jgi:hypothetical protein